ncbi:MAG: AAA family ATPase [Puniceicoccaceae bacterium]
MIDYLKIRCFRGIESADFENLARVNLIVGGNNTGKTSILEAFVLLFGDNEQIKRLPSEFRQSGNDQDVWADFWPNIIHKMNDSSFRLETNEGVLWGGPVRDGHGLFRKGPEDDFSADRRFASKSEEPMVSFSGRGGTVDARFSKTAKRLSILSTEQPDPLVTSELFNQIAPLNPENETKLEELLRDSIEPRLKRLRYARPQHKQQHLVYVDLGDGPMIPFTQMGQAFSRALHVYCEIFSQNPDILLIDEIENGLYYRGLEKYWRGLFSVLEEQDVQLFSTTHSRECMEAAQKASSGEESELRYLRLDREIDAPGRIIGTDFGANVMGDAMAFDQDMR